MKLVFNFLAVTMFFLDNSSSGAETDRLSVLLMEADSVTLHTGVKTKQLEHIKWYFNDIRIAQINGDQCDICTDVQCNEGNEGFRDRLKLDHRTGSLTIMNITTTDSGVYKLQINSSIKNTFSVTVTDLCMYSTKGLCNHIHIDSSLMLCSSFIFPKYTQHVLVCVPDVPAAERDGMQRKSVMEGESVTLDIRGDKKTNGLIIWYFYDIHIAEITGDESKICTDEQCDERFRDRLKLDHQTGSLTITNTRTTDAGLYKQQITISNSSFSIAKVTRFNVAVNCEYTIQYFWIKFKVGFCCDLFC
ncbi:uncharacterized protein [Garra rufa]|uniref:uncharacterized protein n=1 Tax=Garra rufa TaxID=137080 RepID=UPI003CCEA05A